jgi:hypothetical protein
MQASAHVASPSAPPPAERARTLAEATLDATADGLLVLDGRGRVVG